MSKKNKRSQEIIDREKAKLREELENVSVDDILNDASAPTDRQYARKFKELYNGVRKALVLIQKKKATGLYTNQEAYETSLEVLNRFVSE